MTIMGFEVNASKVKSQTGHKKALTAQYLDNPMHDEHKILYTGTS
jgi:hypothetical protein